MSMKTVLFSDLGEDIRASLQHQRWLVLTAEELPHATAVLALSELEDVLVAVDHRHHPVEYGLWMRAVHLLLVDDSEDAASLQLESGITKVVVTEGALEQHLW